MITNFKKFESAEIIMDYENDIEIANFDDIDARSFGYYNDELYIGSDYHCNLVDDLERRDFEYPGRLWLNKKLISFYIYPQKEKFAKVLNDIKEKSKIENDEDIDWEDGWRIEIYKDVIDTEEYWDDFEEWSYFKDTGDFEKIEIIPISEYVGSKDVDMNNIPPHMMNYEEKKKWLKKRGYKPKHIKTPKNMTQTEYRNKVTKYKYTESKKI